MLNTKALAASASAAKVYVEDVFSTWLYTGSITGSTINNGIDLAGKGGLVWIKSRSNAYDNVLVDQTRAGTGFLVSNSTLAELSSNSAVTAFNSNGFTTGTNNNVSGASSRIYTSWTFRKAAKFFDVVTYTGNETARTISHNLGSAPGCIIVKRTDAASNWNVYHRSILATKYLALNDTTGSSTDTFWNNTDPTSSVFSIGTNAAVNTNGGTYVAYLFAHDAGGFGDSGNESIIKCGTFTTDGAANATVNLGWEPQWVMVKSTNGPFGWEIYDTMRGFSLTGHSYLKANTTDAESSSAGMYINNTGFSTSGYWGNNYTFVYIAIRRGPMKTPTDATKVFKAVTQTSQGTVSTDFPVDMVIMGDRSSTWGYNWSVQDRLRGKSAVLFTSATTAENTTSLSTFDSNKSFKDGWVSGGTSAVYETFRRAPGFFDVVAYTGTGSARTVSHNLGVVPELMIVKSRSTVQPWPVYSAIDYARSGNILRLNSTDGAAYNFASRFNVVPTSSVFSVGNDTETNSNGVNYIAYLFASLSGISKVGSYTGTGTTAQINCGFTNGARFVMIKRTSGTSAAGGWYVWDSARGIVSGNDPYLLLNQTNAEVTDTDYIDAYSAGFEISSTAPAEINANGGSFIFLAIA